MTDNVFSCYAHAIQCGINMTGKLALPVAESAGYLLMMDVTHPETLKPILHAGTTMDQQLITVAQEYGVDYVVVYKAKMHDVHETLSDIPCPSLLKELIERMVHTNGLEFCARGDIYLAKCMLDDRFRDLRRADAHDREVAAATQRAAYALVLTRADKK